MKQGSIALKLYNPSISPDFQTKKQFSLPRVIKKIEHLRGSLKLSLEFF